MSMMHGVDYVKRAYRDALSGSFSRKFWVLMSISTVYDQAIAASGYHVFPHVGSVCPKEAVYETVEWYMPSFRNYVLT